MAMNFELFHWLRFEERFYMRKGNTAREYALAGGDFLTDILVLGIMMKGH